ncbi:hypothetical protein GCM10023187_21590 [Nibrella viscosa]|uniref:Uncharacterized protein n=1 Tax=Nibrella viscosa TaxID=1084524 RepID=A0ABP8KDY9_9BACT
MLIDSQTIRAEVFRKGENDFWFLASEAQSINESIYLASIDLTISMPVAYADTEDILPVNA